MNRRLLYKYNQQLEEKLINPNASPSTFWSITSKYMGSKSYNIPSLLHDEEVISDNRQKAIIFNDFFASISHMSQPDYERTLPDDAATHPVKLLPPNILEHEVYYTLIKLDESKATGPDTICNKILKHTALAISYPLAFIFNKSLSASVFPSS